jgi:hypothetical protein
MLLPLAANPKAKPIMPPMSKLATYILRRVDMDD